METPSTTPEGPAGSPRAGHTRHGGYASRDRAPEQLPKVAPGPAPGAPQAHPEGDNTIAAARAARPDLDLLRPGKQRDRIAAANTIAAPQTEDLETDTDDHLISALHALFDRYGVLGVITTAARYGLRNATPTQCDEPHLGLATTRQLLAEITTRIQIDYHSGGGGLDYSTVKGRP